MSVQSEIDRINATKTNLKTAIENGGVSVSSSAKIDTYPSLVDSITEGFNQRLDIINGEVV